MKKLFIIILFLSSVQSFSQLTDNWFGHYIGELSATNLAGTETFYRMEMKIEKKTDFSYQFLIIYGEDSLKQERNYILNSLGNHKYELDEQNGITLQLSFHNNALYSVFEVQNNLIHVIYRISKKGILFELISSNNKTESGGETADPKENIPVVNSYSTVAFQSAFLKRQ